MPSNWWYYSWKLGLASFLVMGGAIASLRDCALAQITPDDTLGAESSVITPSVNNGIPRNQIDGGAMRGANLFHSFREFNISERQEAYFTNPFGIENILSRVTGNDPSDILGRLGVLGNADLFLINPSGIIFGPNARLDVRGSFIGSTASSLNFFDGTQFSATAPQTTPLLTVSVPLGLQFGGTAGSIQMQGLGAVRLPNYQLINRTAGLQVPRSQTLALVGSGIELEGGILTTDGGRVELGSVTAGLVSLTPTDKGWALGYSGVPTFADIQLSQQATVDGGESGDIQVRGRQVTLTDGSQIQISTLRSEPGGTLNFTATESAELIGTTVNGQFSSGLSASVFPGATGAGGNLNLETGQLIVRDGAQVRTSTFGAGAAGTLDVTSDSVELIGRSAIGQQFPSVPSGLFTTVNPNATGDSGTLTVETGRLSVRDGARVEANTSSGGAAGNLEVRALESVELTGTSADGRSFSGLATNTSGAGDAGNLTVETGQLIVRDGAQANATTSGAGNVGSLTVRASEIDLVRTGTVAGTENPSALQVRVEAGARGDGGGLTIEANRLSVRDGAEVSASTSGQGTAGGVLVRANDSVFLANSGDISTQVRAGAVGNGGDIDIQTRSLTVVNGSQVNAEVNAAVSNGERFIPGGRGRGGNIRVDATDSVTLTGVNTDRLSTGLFTVIDQEAIGDAGDITVNTSVLQVQDGATVNAQTFNPDDGGNITLSVQDLLWMRNNSLISAEASGDGYSGNIDINTGFLVAAPSENNDIVASANQGGSIEITSQGIFGVQFRESPTPESDITATGTVTFNTPDVDPNQGLVTLPAELVDASNQIAADCTAAGEGKFIITGRGGLPPSPNEPLSGEAVITEWATLNQASDLSSAEGTATTTRVNVPTQIVEARGWAINNKGEVLLTATAPTVTPYSPWLTLTDCHASKNPS